MRDSRCTLVLGAGCFFIAHAGASDAIAQEQAAPSAPHGTNLRGTDGTETASSVLSFGCSYVLQGESRRLNYNKLTCRFATTGIGRPTANEVAQRLRDLEAPQTQKEKPEGFPAVCKTLTPASPPAEPGAALSPLRIYHEKLAKACADQDATAGKEALRYHVTEVWAKTCEAFNHGVREYEFQKSDDVTWRAMDGVAAGGAATIRTIWRKQGTNEFSSWNYKQVTSADPSCVPAPFRECAKDATNEWTSEATFTLTGCQFFS